VRRLSLPTGRCMHCRLPFHGPEIIDVTCHKEEKICTLDMHVLKTETVISEPRGQFGLLHLRRIIDLIMLNNAMKTLELTKNVEENHLHELAGKPVMWESRGTF
jgi:hypothetical protein